MSRLNISEVKFFSAGILTILEHLHKKRVILRDVRPDIFKVGYDGYLVLQNMAASKININVDKNMQCKTILGTPHYMAPEMISQKPYNYHVDLWSFGVTLYEMICGVVPFGEGVEDPYEIYHAILGKN